MEFNAFVETVGQAIELAGVAVIVVGIVVSFVTYASDRLHQMSDDRKSSGTEAGSGDGAGSGSEADDAYERARRSVGRSILLGLELLVAGDIVRTIVISPSFTSVGVLAAVVAIRTFLSFTLELEITGRWPWQSGSPT